MRVAVTDPGGARFLQTQGKVGQIVPLAAGVTDDDAVARAVAGASLVVNGGYFDAKRRPEGLVRVEGAELSPFSPSLGGGVFSVLAERAVL